MANILLYEPKRADLPHLVFLLKLADISCTASRSADEALNWLKAERMKVIHFDLLLLSRMQDLEHREDIWQAARLLRLPIVYIKRQRSEPQPMPAEEIMLCNPDELLDCLKKRIFSEKNTTERRMFHDQCR